MTTKINLDQKFGLFDDQWRPKVIAAMNGQEIKLVKVKGEFPWHRHQQEDEFFLVWKGRFRVEFRDHIVEMSPGECVVVPRGVEHRTCADEGGGNFALRTVGNRQHRQCRRRRLHRANRDRDLSEPVEANGRGPSTGETEGPTVFGTPPGADVRRSMPRRQLRF
jgi:mannose-6-phosphate isomerase-like protein (cupin superfamily)